jgi:hypothetical protein
MDFPSFHLHYTRKWKQTWFALYFGLCTNQLGAILDSFDGFTCKMQIRSLAQIFWFLHKILIKKSQPSNYIYSNTRIHTIPMSSMTKTWSLKRIGAGHLIPAAFSLQFTMTILNTTCDSTDSQTTDIHCSSTRSWYFCWNKLSSPFHKLKILKWQMIL